MRKAQFFLFLLLSLAGLGCTLVCGGMTFMAVRYMEWGRVLLYGVLTVFSLELLVFSLYRMKKGG